MLIADQAKNFVKKQIERKPPDDRLRLTVRIKKATAIKFRDDGIIPNHPRWPLVIYRQAIDLSDKHVDPAVVDAIFESNGWGRSWRDTIYDFAHYHSQIHEVLGVAKGSANVEFGGVKGRVVELRAGDVAILPAGTGHRLIKSSRNFLVVGAYPTQGTYDEITDTRARIHSAKSIAKVPRPKANPVYGKRPSMSDLWLA